MGTAAAPAVAAASSVSAQASELGTRSATRSPGRTPAATSARARPATRAARAVPTSVSPLAASISAGAIDAALRRLPGVAHVDVHFARAEEGRGRDPFAQRAALPGVAHIIAVASTKGGVGKSTVAVNLALALAGEGRRRVGLVDADVYGPSLPIMFGTDARPRVGPDKRIHPLERHGIKLMSMGFFLDEQSPVIWRGPIVMGIVRQFLRDVEWGELDLLVVDLPPG